MCMNISLAQAQYPYLYTCILLYVYLKVPIIVHLSFLIPVFFVLLRNLWFSLILDNHKSLFDIIKIQLEREVLRTKTKESGWYANIFHIHSNMFLLFLSFTASLSILVFDISKMAYWIACFILLPEKFLQFNRLRAEVFHLNLKYLHVKITVTMANHEIILSHELRKNGRKISRFSYFGGLRTKRKFRKPNAKKSLSTWLSWAKNQEVWNQFACLQSDTTRRKVAKFLLTWISQVVV